jgi:hypothetical protein
MNLNGTAHTREGGKAVKRTLIIAAVLLATVVFALPAPAGSIDGYIDGPWMKFLFGSNGSLAYGECTAASCEQMYGTNYVDLGESPWQFDVTSPAMLKITDAFLKGDRFEVHDFGSLVLTTPYVAAEDLYGYGCGSNPELCYGLTDVSWGSLSLAAGSHSLTIRVLESPFNSGAAYFRIDRIIGAPEPLSLILLGLGLLGLGAIRRSRG